MKKEERKSNHSSLQEKKRLSDNDVGNNDPKSPFIHWGIFNSRNKDKPDILEIRPQSKEIFATELSQCTNVSYKEDGKWKDFIVPLKANSSSNASLLYQWKKGLEDGRLKIGKVVKILTWMDTSKNGNPIRRYRLVIT